MRLAVYFAPAADSALHRVASRWLGRDAVTGAPCDQPEVPGLTAERFAELTAEPRRYGFHATLKAPFALAAGAGEADAIRRIEALAQSLQAFEARLAVSRIDGFVALTPATPTPAIDALGAACVRGFDDLRAPLSPADYARRKPDQLSARQRDYLQAWGYPYVFEEFRFHMTLSGRLTAAEAALVETTARGHFGPLLVQAVAIDRLMLFREPAPGAPFTQAAEVALAKAA